MAVLDVCRVNMDGEEKSVRVSDDMAFAPVNTLTRVVSARAAGVSRRCTLAVNDGGRWLCRASKLLSRSTHQNRDNLLPPSGIAPGIEIALNRRIWRKLPRQRAPLTTRRQNIEDRLHHSAQIGLPRPAQSAWWRQQAPQQRPLRIRHIACVAKSVPPIVSASGLSPGHRDLPRIFANPMESQPAGITHPFFSQALRCEPCNGEPRRMTGQEVRGRSPFEARRCAPSTSG